jgi:hypothetical protein
MTTYSIKTKLTETGKLTLDHLPFQKGDEIEITINKSNSSLLKSNDEIWLAYLQSEEEREEVYQRLANS